MDGVRFETRRDPDAPLLVLLHDDGEDERSTMTLGRTLWTGAPLASPRGRHPHGAGRSHLEERRSQLANLAFEEGGIDRLAEQVRSAAAREPSLVVRVGIGVGGGADAALALLCRHPGLFSAAVLLRPRRSWSSGSLDEIEASHGVEVLIVAESLAAGQSLMAKVMLSRAGHMVDIVIERIERHLEISRAWLHEQLSGESDDDA